MITVGVIRNGATYLSHHLRKNDYWAEGEKEVRGEWIGEGAKALGLAGAVTDEPFDALRQNRHPGTGEPLTARDRENRVAFFDVQLSAPKDVSVLAMVGGDERIREAFVESVKTAFAEMERFAAVRERRGSAVTTEAYRLTRNVVGALFLHDTSRDLDPQLHAHAVLANATWDADRSEWLALQPVEMLRASAYLRQVLYRELAGRLRSLGYEPYGMNSKGFSVRGVEHLRERFSKRARHVQKLAEDYAKEKGRKSKYETMERLVRQDAQREMRPEIFARITLAAVFNKLDYDVQCQIAEGMITKECAALLARGFAIEPDRRTLDVIVQRGYHERLGARPMRDATELLIRNALARELLHGGHGAGRLHPHVNGQELQLSPHPPASA